jgi:hypothetical protein
MIDKDNLKKFLSWVGQSPRAHTAGPNLIITLVGTNGEVYYLIIRKIKLMTPHKNITYPPPS